MVVEGKCGHKFKCPEPESSSRTGTLTFAHLNLKYRYSMPMKFGSAQFGLKMYGNPESLR